jgi:hypothetical protein
MVLEYTASLTNGDITDLPVGFEIELLLGDQLLDLYKYLPVVFLVKGIDLSTDLSDLLQGQIVIPHAILFVFLQ